jgi:hypothetical protein
MFKTSKMLAAYAVAIPLALFLGCLTSSPNTITFGMIGMILFFMAAPLFLKWHHALLIIFWNSAFNLFFLPGSPDVWLLCAVLSFGLSFLNHILIQKKFLRVPEMTRPLLFLAAVVLGTACYRGGIGFQILGGAVEGGRNYIYVLGAIVGYFALTAEQVPILKSGKMAALYFLSGTTYALSNIAYALGPAFYFLYYLVPAGYANDQAASDYGFASIDRISGLGPACIAAFCFLLARYGIRGLFDWAKPWRFLFLCVTVGACVFAGYRSMLMVLFLIFALQFYLEGLLRTYFLPMFAGLAMFILVPILLLSDKMPLAVQRAISFLPVKVDSDVRADAVGSTDWRVQMWAVVWKDVPKYLIIGKGYAIDPTEMYLTTEAIRMGLISNYEEALLAGDYHSGPLSVIVPFGIGGAVAFLWVLGAGYWVLYSNYRYGDVKLRRINTVLLSYYLAYAVSFFFVFGSFYSQLFIFLGAAGFGVSLNGGVKKAPASKDHAIALPEPVAMELG